MIYFKDVNAAEPFERVGESDLADYDKMPSLPAITRPVVETVTIQVTQSTACHMDITSLADHDESRRRP